MMVFMYANVLSIPMFKNSTHNTHFSMTVIFQQNRRVYAMVQSLIIEHMHPYVYWRENRTYAPICILEGKYRKSKATLKNMLRDFFEGTCIVKYAFKVTSQDSPYI